MAAGDVLSGMNRYPSAGWFSTGAYIISGIPYLFTKTDLAEDTIHTVRFPSISREVTVVCHAQSLKVHFKHIADPAAHYILLEAGQGKINTITLPARAREISVTGGAENTSFSIAATLTGIQMPKNVGNANNGWPADSFPQWDDAGGTA